MKNTTVSLTLKVTGNAGQQLKRMADEQVRSTQKINQNWTQIGTAQARFVSTAKAGTQATLSTAKASEKNLQTNRMLEGVLRQQSIQTRLQAQAFKQQQSSAAQMLATMQRMEQSARQTRQHVNKTNQDLKSSSSLWQKGTAVAGGTVASGMVISNAMQKPRDYAQLMTYIAATASGGQGLSTSDRLGQMKTLEGYVRDTVRNGGGKREDVAAALNELIASGKYDTSTVKPALLASAKTAFAAGADTIDAAKMTIAMQNFGVRDLALGQDRAMRAGQVGSFEYKDLSRYLPEQMAMAKVAGYSGDEGLVKLLALNQTAKITAADSSIAGNNVVNLLQKITSRELTNTLEKAITDLDGLPTRAVKNKKGQIVGQSLDVEGYFIQERSKGNYAVEALVKLVDRELKGNDRYNTLRKEADAAKTPDERRRLLDEMSSIVMGSQIGQFIADRQAMSALLAVQQGKAALPGLEKEIGAAAGTVDADLAMINQTEWAKNQALEQEKLFAQSKAYDALSGSLGDLKDMVVGVASKHETLAASAYGATVALTALAGGAALATVVGGKGGGGKVTSAAKKAGGAVATAASRHPVVAGTVSAGAVGYTVGSVISKGIEGTSLNDKIGELATKVWAALGNETAQAALEANAKYEQMIAQQERQNGLSADISAKLGTLIGVTQANGKPVINYTQNISPVTSLLRPPMSNANRQAAPAPAYLLRPKQ